MEVVHTIRELRDIVRAWKRSGESIGVVPTMGALHTGHLSLVQASCERCAHTVVTLFVNPTQFGPTEDLAKYPRTLEADIAALRSYPVDLLFVPAEAEIYPAGCSTSVQPPAVAREWEGAVRPHHFQGVATVVLKLLNLTLADRAYFGQKDLQQVAVVRQMVRDLDVDCEIVVCPIVRDPDGLAMSSRNRYLSPSERAIALTISQALRHGRELLTNGETDGHVVSNEMTQVLIDGGINAVDYAAVVDPDSFVKLDQIKLPAALIIAARVGATRLIDNEVAGNWE